MRRRSYVAVGLACSIAFVAVIAFLAWQLMRPTGEIIRDAPRATAATTKEALTELDAIEPTNPVSVGLTDQVLPIEEGDGQAFPRAMRPYTVMVYMTGTDLEERGGNASIDLVEMMNSGFDASHTNVVVYTGGSSRWLVNIPNNRNCVIEVANGGGQVVASTNQSCNMGSASTLSEFVSWALANYPAEHTGLVIWDHGGGPSKGCSFDQLFDRDPLTLPEMREAMSAAGLGSKQKLDWVGFDACLMNSLETAQVWRDFAHYFIASQDVENHRGWNYGFLPHLKDVASDREAAGLVVASFKDYFEAHDSDGSGASATLSVLDLGDLDNIEEALSRLSKRLLWDFKNDNFATLAQAREQSRSFGGVGGSVAQNPLVDLVDLSDKLAEAHPAEAKMLRRAVNHAVVDNFTSMSGANGCSMYFAAYGAQSSVEPVTKSFGQMLAAYAERSASVATDEWPEPEVVFVEDDLPSASGSASGVIQETLTQEQTKSLASVSYTVLANHEDEGFVPLMQNVRVQADKSGAIEVPADPRVLVLCEKQPVVVPVEQIERREGRTLYTCSSTSLLPAPEYLGTAGAADVVVTFAEENGVVGIASSALVGSEEGAADGRLDAELERYESLMFSYGGSQNPKRTDDGRLLPYTLWGDDAEGLVLSEVPLEDDMSYKLAPVSALEGSYYLQLVFTDINGNQHASELIELTSPKCREVVLATEAGELRFACEQDHARLVGYSGSDVRLALPAMVEDLPVTEIANGVLDDVKGVFELSLPDTLTSIGNSALNLPDLVKLELGDGLRRIGRDSVCDSPSLRELELPSALKSVGRGSLRGLGVRALRLPKSLARVGEGALTSLQSLESFELEEGSKSLSCADGVLFSADGQTLLAFPAGREGAYDVPQGTTTIAYAAFAGTALREVGLPEGVRAIGNAAFIKGKNDEHTNLELVRLPRSLETIGAYAFGSLYNGPSFSEAPEVDEIYLGPQLSYLGEGAFGGLRLKRFSVDVENKSFAEAQGLLANKMGDTIIEAPSGMGPVVYVPEGVTTVGSDVFSLLDAGCDFVLPETLTRISQEAFARHVERDSAGDETIVYDVRFHCAKTSAAAEFASRHDISCDEETDVGVLVPAFPQPQRQSDL